MPDCVADIVCTLRDTRCDAAVDVHNFMSDVRDRDQWVVAFDRGPYLLTVGSRKIRLEILAEDQFDTVLSHRWDPVLSTTFGPIPTPMLEASYTHPCWIDVLNHLNIQEFTERVVSRMGGLYATKKCRALYFETSTVNEPGSWTGVVAASRAWMWQELSIGPQSHRYCDIRSVLVHFIVVIGEENALKAALSLLRTAALLVRMGKGASEHDLREEASGFKRPQQLLEMLQMFKHAPMYSFFPAFMAARGFSEAESTALGDALAEAQSAHLSKSRLAFSLSIEFGSKLMVFCEKVLEAAQVVFLKRDTVHDADALVFALEERLGLENATFLELRGLKASAVGQLVATQLDQYAAESDSGGLSVAICEAAMAMLLARFHNGTSSWLTSAISNLGNRNVSADEDRMVASFAVLCARLKVPCDVRSVNETIYRGHPVEAVHVVCLPESATLGVTAVAQKEVWVAPIVSALHKRDPPEWNASETSHRRSHEEWELLFQEEYLSRFERPTIVGNGWEEPPQTVFQSLDGWTRSCKSESVELGGVVLGRCKVTAVVPLSARVAEWLGLHRPFTATRNTGHLASYELSGQRLAKLQVQFEDGRGLTIEPESWKATDFQKWHKALPPACEHRSWWKSEHAKWVAAGALLLAGKWAAFLAVEWSWPLFWLAVIVDFEIVYNCLDSRAAWETLEDWKRAAASEPAKARVMTLTAVLRKIDEMELATRAATCCYIALMISASGHHKVLFFSYLGLVFGAGQDQMQAARVLLLLIYAFQIGPPLCMLVGLIAVEPVLKLFHWLIASCSLGTAASIDGSTWRMQRFCAQLLASVAVAYVVAGLRGNVYVLFGLYFQSQNLSGPLVPRGLITASTYAQVARMTHNAKVEAVQQKAASVRR